MDEDAFLSSSIELYLARQNQQLMKDGKNITNYKTSKTLDYKEVSGEEESLLEKSVLQYLTRQNNQLLEKYRNSVHSEISQIINKEECSNELESDMFEKIMDGDVNDKENDEVLVNEVKDPASDDQNSSGNEMNHETNMNNNLSTRDVDNSTETQSSEHENNFVDTVMDESEINCPEDVNHIDFSVDTKTDYQIEDENLISDEAESNSNESDEFSDEDLSTDYEEYDDIYENVPLPNDITLKGDGTVGKTCMLVVYTTGIFPEEYIPTIFENTIHNITVGDKTYEATLWDTAGQEAYERLRALSYPKTSCLLVCYSVDKSLPSYNNIRNKWAAELRHHLPNCPLILVGTKIDLRNDPTKSCYTEEDGNNLKKTIKATKYMECSAKDSLGLNEIFQEAVRKSLSVKGLGKKRECSIL